MALVWSESAQWTTSASRFNRRYTFGSLATLNATGGRNGGASAGSNGVIVYPSDPTPSGDTFIAFIRFRAAVGTSIWLAFGDSITNTSNSFIRAEVKLEITSAGAIKLYRCTNTSSKTQIATTSDGFLSMAGVLYGIALRVKVHGSAGETEVLVDGASVPALALTGANTLNNGTWNSVSINAGGAGVGWSDLVVLDNTNPTGNDPNTILPDVRVDYRPANGNGYLSEFTGSDADSTDNYLHVDETAVDDDTSYVEKLAAGIDAYAVANSPLAGATLVGVTHLSTWRKTDAGVVTAKHGIRASATNYLSSAAALPVSYVTASKCYGVNPAGGAWTEAGFNGIEGVIEKT